MEFHTYVPSEVNMLIFLFVLWEPCHLCFLSSCFLCVVIQSNTHTLSTNIFITLIFCNLSLTTCNFLFSSSTQKCYNIFIVIFCKILWTFFSPFMYRHYSFVNILAWKWNKNNFNSVSGHDVCLPWSNFILSPSLQTSTVHFCYSLQ
jgi:hypothetical protein